MAVAKYLLCLQSKTMDMKTQLVEKTRYSDTELAEFESVIDKKIAQARSQLTFYKNQIADIRSSDDAKPKNLDDASVSSETEQLYALATRQEKMITHLENAKLRIRNKVYGICRETGQLIAKERLMAVPHATLSISAKQKM